MTRSGGESLAVRGASAMDAEAIADMYNHHVLHTIVTFEEEVVSASEMVRRIADLQAQRLPWLVAERAGRVVGYAYGGRWRPRASYRFATEVTVYVAADQGRSGVGSALYGELLPALRSVGMHTAIGGISLPNEGSVALHERFGFEKVAHFAEVGYKLDRWVDVGYWQRRL
jgi:L-amino acid N-acyltransferase YncA